MIPGEGGVLGCGDDVQRRRAAASCGRRLNGADGDEKAAVPDGRIELGWQERMGPLPELWARLRSRGTRLARLRAELAARSDASGAAIADSLTTRLLRMFTMCTLPAVGCPRHPPW